jgi:hypothetical protein
MIVSVTNSAYMFRLQLIKKIHIAESMPGHRNIQDQVLIYWTGHIHRTHEFVKKWSKVFRKPHMNTYRKPHKNTSISVANIPLFSVSESPVDTFNQENLF